jgi:hypothetical protein
LPRFFFDLTDGTVIREDDTGVELATVHEAKLEGAVALAWMMAEAISVPSDKIMYIVLRDEARQPLARVALSLTVKDGG